MNRLLLPLTLIFLATTAQAVMDVPSQGWDGALNITANTTIDLSQAMSGTWNVQPAGYQVGKGIYDPQKWAIVFHYTSVTVASGMTLKLTNHPANAPVVWLVEGAVVIAGTLNIAGMSASSYSYNGFGTGGPGGFRGGQHGTAPLPPTAGFGPGGGRTLVSGQYAGGGSFGTAGNGGGPTYGNPMLLPLIGGSGGGGGGGTNQSHGGGGGGAILIGAQQSVRITGTIDARGGSVLNFGGNGSGGGVRLITPMVSGTGTGQIWAGPGSTPYGYPGGNGRIRIEANQQAISEMAVVPAPSLFDPGDAPQFWPDETTPTARLVALNGLAVPADPHAQLDYPWQDVFLDGVGQVTAVIETTNVPTTGTTLQVFVTQLGGPRTTIPPESVTLVGGNEALATWQAVFTSTNGMFAVQARAVLP